VVSAALVYYRHDGTSEMLIHAYVFNNNPAAAHAEVRGLGRLL
jgi:hypothetical protein